MGVLAISEATDDDLIEFVAPRLSKLVSPWDHLLLRSEQGNPPLPQVSRVVFDYLGLAERSRAFLKDHLEPCLKKSAKLANKENLDETDKNEVVNSELINGVLNEDSIEKVGLDTKDDHQIVEKPDSNTNDQEDKVVEVVDEANKDDPTASSIVVENGLNDDKEGQNEVGKADKLDLAQVDKPPIGDEDEEDDSETAIIVKVETSDQSTTLGLALGKYKVSETLHEEYLPRRFRSILAAQRAGASTRLIEPDEQDGTNQFLQPKRAVVAMETAEDDEVGATLRGDDCGDSFGAGDVNLSQNTGDEQGQNFMSLGEELLLIPDGGLGGPVPDEWLTSGAFLTVLAENGQTSDLVMEAATGRLYHRPTGYLVSLTDSNQEDQQNQRDQQSINRHKDQVNGNKTSSRNFQDDDYEVDEYGGPGDDIGQQRTTTLASKYLSKDRPGPKRFKRSVGRPRKIVESNPSPVQSTTQEDTSSQQEQLLAQLAENGEVIDLNQLFPGVTVTELSPGICLVTKPNGDRFNVEHGGEGITLETLQAILQMDT